METKKKTVYLLKHVEFGYETVYDSLDLGGYVRIAKPVEIEFVLDAAEDQVRAAVDTLERAKKREMADSQTRLNALDEQIQRLLAITHTV